MYEIVCVPVVSSMLITMSALTNTYATTRVIVFFSRGMALAETVGNPKVAITNVSSILCTTMPEEATINHGDM